MGLAELKLFEIWWAYSVGNWLEATIAYLEVLMC
jgi:hypothetical protein